MLISLMLAPAGEHRWGADYVRQQVTCWEHFRRGNAPAIRPVALQGELLKARGRQPTDSRHVLAAVRTLNRLELVGETLRAALNAIAVAAPDWLRGIAPPDWHDRYDRRVEDMRLPDTGPKREAYAAQM